MTQDEIIQMVNKVGCKSYSPPPTRSVAGVSMTFAQVEELIKLVAEREREACAKYVEECSLPDAYSEACLPEIADEIRART
jgi:hypothetical protein